MTVPVPAAKCILRQLATAVEYCHARGVLHRDIKVRRICCLHPHGACVTTFRTDAARSVTSRNTDVSTKPANVLISHHGVVKLADFGLARAVPPAADAHLMTERHVVTAGYRAPELLMGDTRYGPGVDTWALGCIAYELRGKGPLVSVQSQKSEHDLLELALRKCGEPGDFLRSLPGCCPGKPCLKKRGEYDSNSMFGTFLRSQATPQQLADLISALLKLNPADRMSAADVLQHPWLSLESNQPPCEPGALDGCSRAPHGLAQPVCKMTPRLYTVVELQRAQPNALAAAALRSQYCDHISSVCRYLGNHGQLPPTAYPTAVIFTHRYFAQMPLDDAKVALLMADAAVLLAAKVLCSRCPAARMLKGLVHASHHLRHGVLPAALTPHHREPESVEELQRKVLYAESCLAHELHLRLPVVHATELLGLAERRLREAGPAWGLPVSLDVAVLVRNASQLSHDALRTHLHNVVPPAVLAAACLLLAARELPAVGAATHEALAQKGRLAKLLRGLSDAAELTDSQVKDACALEHQLREEVNKVVEAAAAHARTTMPLVPAYSPCAPGAEPQWSFEFAAHFAQQGATPPGIGQPQPTSRSGRHDREHHARAPAEAHAGHRRPRDDDEYEEGEVQPPSRSRHHH